MSAVLGQWSAGSSSDERVFRESCSYVWGQGLSLSVIRKCFLRSSLMQKCAGVLNLQTCQIRHQNVLLPLLIHTGIVQSDG